MGTWNGTNNGGTEVTNGKYYVKIDNIDPTGVVNTQTQAVLVARHLATLTVNIYNEAGELVRRLDQTVADAVTMNTGFNLSASTFSPGYKGGPNTVLTIGLSGGTTITLGRAGGQRGIPHERAVHGGGEHLRRAGRKRDGEQASDDIPQGVGPAERECECISEPLQREGKRGRAW